MFLKKHSQWPLTIPVTDISTEGTCDQKEIYKQKKQVNEKKNNWTTLT